jgi:predicted alpha/beta superfamily hydrolase
MSNKPATIIASEFRIFESKQTGRRYRISIALPYSYFDSPDATFPFDERLIKWPVVYLTDANFYFGLVTDMVRAMSWCGRPSDAIIVGIGYEEQNDPQKAWRDSVSRREYDFTPLPSEKEESEASEWLKRTIETGGAGQFLQFIEQELIPAIESEFNADPNRRILVGHSLGGLFVAYAIFAIPGLFDSYIIGSPALDYGEKCVFKQEDQYSREHKELMAKVFLWVGELEESTDDCMVSNTLRLAAILDTRKYEGLTLVKRIFPDENHCEVFAPGFQASLKWALAKREEVR